ncbi:hypothetical protein ACW9HQ_37905, partial [Nocardia gipuzkoensis]
PGREIRGRYKRMRTECASERGWELPHQFTEGEPIRLWAQRCRPNSVTLPESRVKSDAGYRTQLSKLLRRNQFTIRTTSFHYRRAKDPE